MMTTAPNGAQLRLSQPNTVEQLGDHRGGNRQVGAKKAFSITKEREVVGHRPEGGGIANIINKEPLAINQFASQEAIRRKNVQKILPPTINRGEEAFMAEQGPLESRKSTCIVPIQ